MFDTSLNSLSTRKLKRMLSMFDPRTEEWIEIRQIILYRKWHLLYGKEAADFMLREWRKLSNVRLNPLTSSHEQLTIEMPGEE
jgi:hypothetical protein